MARLLGIDVGGKRVGIAATDPMQIIASPLTTLAAGDEVLQFLKTYLKEQDVERIVVGMPLALNGDDTDATPIVRNFLDMLSKNFPDIPVDTEDESFTSKTAMQSMITAGYKKKDRREKGNLDKVSAALILQSYMEKNS